jgi:aldehyde:ferredoxin oxidoreductase
MAEEKMFVTGKKGENMPKDPLGGYTGKILRVDLSNKKISPEKWDAKTMADYVGGTGLGVKILSQEVPQGIEWNDPQNRLILASGPLAGTTINGSGTFSAVTRGPMTNLAVATQANGFFGAYLKMAGFDAVVFQGSSPSLVYLYIHDGTAELRDARSLAGKDTWETEEAVLQELGLKRNASAYCIGPAGENLVRFAAIVGDKGHVAAHNGVGAVMGCKKLKAVVTKRGDHKVGVRDRDKLIELGRKLFEESKKILGGALYQYGTGGILSTGAQAGWLPVKNYTTNIFPEHEKINGQYLRAHFEMKPNPCYACRIHHVHQVKVTEGPYKGFEGEEPEYECLAGMGSQIGVTDAGSVVFLSNLVDRLGMDVNESSWIIGWLMECFEKGILKKSELDGLEMTWGNVEAVKEMLQKISRREGLGNILAEGVKRASEKMGRSSSDLAVYTLKGATPRGHDHRGMGRWGEMFDTCLSNTSTIEATFGAGYPPQLGVPPVVDAFSPEEVSTVNAKINGWRQFEDCLGTCRFCTPDALLTVESLNAVTGWNLTVADAMTIGRRIVNLLRVFNFRHGLKPELEAPSARYGSTPVDGPCKGKSIRPHWPGMVRNYYKLMGWDENTGKPLPETLRSLGLEDLIKDIPR